MSKTSKKGIGRSHYFMSGIGKQSNFLEKIACIIADTLDHQFLVLKAQVIT